MINLDKTKKTVKTGLGAAIGATLTGAAVGAGAVLLSDKKNRDKIKKALISAKDQIQAKLEDVQDEAVEALEEVKNTATNSKSTKSKS